MSLSCESRCRGCTIGDSTRIYRVEDSGLANVIRPDEDGAMPKDNLSLLDGAKVLMIAR